MFGRCLHGFASPTGSSRFRLANGQGRTTQPLRSSPITGPSTLLRAAPRFGTLALAVGAACGLSLHVVGVNQAQVLTFQTKAGSSFAPPIRRMPLGQYQGIPRTDPGGRVSPRVLTSSNPISTLLQRFACARLSQPCLMGSCPNVSATFTTIAFDDSSLR